jgi:hypothetical protein
MAGLGPSSLEFDETASPTTIQQTGSTGRKSGTWRAHLGEKRSLRTNQRRCAAWRGGRLGLRVMVTGFSSTTVASRGRDGGGVVRHPAYIAMEQFQERKGEIGAWILSRQGRKATMAST